MHFCVISPSAEGYNASGLRKKKIHDGSYCGYRTQNYSSKSEYQGFAIALGEQNPSLQQEECNALHFRVSLWWSGWAAKHAGHVKTRTPSHLSTSEWDERCVFKTGLPVAIAGFSLFLLQ